MKATDFIPVSRGSAAEGRSGGAEKRHDASLPAARQRLQAHMEARGMRKTPERFAILERAMTMQGHFSGDELYSRLEEEGYHVSRSTIYSTLTLLCDCGLIRRHLLNARRAGYEVAERNHCHLLCTRCGSIEEVATDEDPLFHGEYASGFIPSYYSTIVYGICRECSGVSGIMS